jgi:hypothetical protein
MEAQLRNQQTPARWKMPSANADTISWNDYPTRIVRAEAQAPGQKELAGPQKPTIEKDPSGSNAI